MSRKANKALIGAFVVAAVALLVVGIVIFGSGDFFRMMDIDRYVLYFDGSLKGLSAGAPVIFRGVKIGSVKDISLVFDQKTRMVTIPVIVDLELSRVKGVPEKIGYPNYGRLIDEGLRAKVEIQSFLTGQLMISFDFYPDTKPKLHNIPGPYPELPTLPISPDIFDLMDQLPLKEISDNLNQTTAGISKLVNSGALQETFYELKNALQETTQAARSLRFLTEYLEQHPEAFLKGKPIPKGE